VGIKPHEFGIERDDDERWRSSWCTGRSTSSRHLASAAAVAAVGVVLDLIDVDFLDSTGLREVLVSQRELGGRLAIVCDPTVPPIGS